jgi:hypothetical protein
MKKSVADLSKLYQTGPSPEKKAVEDLRNKINGLLERDPHKVRKAAQILEHWLIDKKK